MDVEGVHGDKPFSQMARGEIGLAEDWGALCLARLFVDCCVEGTFFVDVYESSLYGENVVGKLCQEIDALGQDVQLHTHPSWRDDPRDFEALRKLKRSRCFMPQTKDFLYKCSLEEQIELISWGSNFLSNFLGKRPVAHRAGGYGADENTLRALSELGFAIDSSMFVHPNCRLDLKKNSIDFKHGVLQIPITGFEKHQRLTLGAELSRRHFPFFRTGVDDCGLDELLWFVDEMAGSGTRVMNLFMHSYSLLDFDKTFAWFRPSESRRQKLRNFLKQIRHRDDVKVISMREFYETQIQSLPLEQIVHSKDLIPSRIESIPLADIAIGKAKKQFLSLRSKVTLG